MARTREPHASGDFGAARRALAPVAAYADAPREAIRGMAGLEYLPGCYDPGERLLRRVVRPREGTRSLGRRPRRRLRSSTCIRTDTPRALFTGVEDAAFARCAAITDASGLEPPDVDDLQWQGMMGMAEAGTRDAARLALERALESRDPRPAKEIVSAVLSEPDPDGVHATRLAAVHAERIDRWAGWRDSPRRALLGPLVDELVGVRVPEWPADDVLDWLLDEAQTGWR